eukprot:TRINITY_DN62642_c0_g1_i1.p1 TRINITY_DN62642_c0_g1~~TRINITY_DN62642_c0_g1_i1.p1  ORF type:complete len:762 (-),score=88.25 TRINITY_DN62642_c0_g1_i1:169-2454(-)
MGRASCCHPYTAFDGPGERNAATRSLLKVACSSFVAGCTTTLLLLGIVTNFHFELNFFRRHGDVGGLWSVPSTRSLDLKFHATKAEEVLGELSAQEIQAAASWFLSRRGGSPSRNASEQCLWLAGPSAVELAYPPKSEALAYIEGVGPRPPRQARLVSVGPGGVAEYILGPLVDGRVSEDAVLKEVKSVRVPYTKRPTEPSADLDLMAGLINSTCVVLKHLLLEAFGPIFPMFDGFSGDKGVTTTFFRNHALVPPKNRIDIIKFLWTPPPPQQNDANWVHPLPIDITVNTTAVNPEHWNVISVKFCGQTRSSADELRAAYNKGEIRLCKVRLDTGRWDAPQRETPPSPSGRHFRERHGGVSWGPWSFTITQRPSTGPALLDVRFRGERVLYELSLQDAQAAYGGGRHDQFFYSDGSWSLSMLSASLEPGVDCPNGAHYLSVSNWYHLEKGGAAKASPTEAFEFRPICIFEWDEDHTIWRHMQNTGPPSVHGLVRKTVVVRSITTVSNYDYITDMKFREDGEIEVHTRFAGYIESRYFDPKSNPQETNFSTILRPGLAGPVHSHLVSFKADLDIAGVRANALRATQISTMHIGDGWESKYIQKHDVEREGIGQSTFVADPRKPGNWAIIDRATPGNPRGYAITLGTWSNTQVLPDNHPFTRAMPWTKYHLAVTRHHDSEYRVNSPYVQYDGLQSDGSGQNLDLFLSDGEHLLDEDLVAWIGVGKEHIVRQEDLPLVSNFGVGFSLQPWNFFSTNMAASPMAS